MNLEAEMMSSIATQVAAKTQSCILDQLNDFISRGLIEIQMGPMTFVQSDDFASNKNEVRIAQSCKLVLKDREYIEKLESENKELREVLMRLRAAM